MELHSDVVSIRPLVLSDLDAFLELRARNRAFFTGFEPRRDDPEEGYSRASLERLIVASDRSWSTGRGYDFGVFTGERDLVGRVALSNVVRAAWQNATIGYYIDEGANGRGIATEAVRLAVRFAFEHAELHRVQGAVMPRNTASRRVLEKVGFEEEGLARWYLQIAGRWEDHVVYAMTTELRERLG